MSTTLKSPKILKKHHNKTHFKFTKKVQENCLSTKPKPLDSSQYGLFSLRLASDTSKIQVQKQRCNEPIQYSSNSLQLSKQIYSTAYESIKRKPKCSKPKQVKKPIENNKSGQQSKKIDKHQIIKLCSLKTYEKLFTVLNTSYDKLQPQQKSYTLSERIFTQEDELIPLVKQFNTEGSTNIKSSQSRTSRLEIYAIRIQRFWRGYCTRKLIGRYIILMNKIAFKPVPSEKSSDIEIQSFIISQQFNNSINESDGGIASYNEINKFRQLNKVDSETSIKQQPLQIIVNQVEKKQEISQNVNNQIIFYEEKSKQLSEISKSENISSVDDELPNFLKRDHHCRQHQQQQVADNTLLDFKSHPNLTLRELEDIINKKRSILEQNYNQEILSLQRQLKSRFIDKEEFQCEVAIAKKWMKNKQSQVQRFDRDLRNVADKTKDLLKQLKHYKVNIQLHKSQSDSSLNFISKQAQKNIQKLYIKKSTNILKREVKLSREQKQLLISQTCEDLEYSLINQIIEYILKHEQTYLKFMKIFSRNSTIQKPKGIRTDHIIVDSFILKFLEFIYTKQPSVFNKMPLAMSPNPLQIIKLIRTDDADIQTQQDIIPARLFEAFQSIILNLMTFQRQYEDQILEQQRIKFIKNLINIHNEAIFHALNQALDFQRIYGVQGQPLPWKTQQRFIWQQFDIDAAINNARLRVLQMQSYSCGIHPQKITLKDETKRNLFLQNQNKNNLRRMQLDDLQSQEVKWTTFDIEETFVSAELSDKVAQFLWEECIREVFQNF